MTAAVSSEVGRPLAGYTIGITGHRRWEEQAEMLSRQGGRVVHGPTMSTTLLDDLDATIAATRRVLAAPADVVVLTTGIGVRSWFGAAESMGMGDELKHALGAGLVVARGPKAQSAARAAGLEVAWTAPTETNAEVLARLTADGIAGRRIVVQRDGGAPLFADALAVLAPRRGGRRARLPLEHAGGRDAGAQAARGGHRAPARRRHVHLLVRGPQHVRAQPRP